MIWHCCWSNEPKCYTAPGCLGDIDLGGTLQLFWMEVASVCGAMGFQQVFTEEVIERLIQGRVKVYPVEHHAIQKGRHRSKLILGYGNVRETEIEQGISRLNTALQRTFS